MTKSLAWQFAAPLGITVDTLMPGPTETGGSSLSVVCLKQADRLDMMELVDPKFVEPMKQSGYGGEEARDS